MSMRLTPHALAQINPDRFREDPVRRYLLPLADERLPDHPLARPDSLGERSGTAATGLVQRYADKALLLVGSTCPTYCGHCTRQRAVGPSMPALRKEREASHGPRAYPELLEALRQREGIRDVTVSGGDVAVLPPAHLEALLEGLLRLPQLRSIRLATKALAVLPQWALAPDTLHVLTRQAEAAEATGVRLSIQTHINTAAQLGPLVREATRALRAAGIHEVRNQAVLLKGVNDRPQEMLDLCRGLADHGIRPYYVYLCDLVPGGEHWRVPVDDAMRLERQLIGRLPGPELPRFVVDLPGLGKRPLHTRLRHDPGLGVHLWADEPIERGAPERGPVGYPDPLAVLPTQGRRFWERSDEELRFALRERFGWILP